MSGVSSSVSSICFSLFWVASSLLRCGGVMFAITGSHCVGVGLIAPEIVRMVELSWTSTLLVWALRVQVGAQYSAAL